MKENFGKSLAAVLVHEGGFINHPRDPGGITNLGVTKRVWEQWVGRKVWLMRGLTSRDGAVLCFLPHIFWFFAFEALPKTLFGLFGIQ